ILALSLGLIIVGHWFSANAEMFGGAKQIALAISGLKSAGLFILAYTTLRLRRGKIWLAGIVVFEIAMGMIGFFADFKTTVFVLLCAVFVAQGRLRARGIVVLAAGAVVAVFLAVFWQSGKSEFRRFLNQGTQEQVVLQPLEERLEFVAKKGAEYDREQ